jgi:hypothetical protein
LTANHFFNGLPLISTSIPTGGHALVKTLRTFTLDDGYRDNRDFAATGFAQRQLPRRAHHPLRARPR